MRKLKKRFEVIGSSIPVVCIMIILIYLGFGILPAYGVDEGKTSYTADAVCAFRAIGASDPDPKTRNPDQMAKLFVNPVLKEQFPGLGLAYEDAKVAADGMNTGVLFWINARTLHIDTLLTQALGKGFQQVVIMGAGFDSRAYRFHQDHPSVRFFEIDLPATSKDKQMRVQKILGRRPDWVTYVPIDFNTQTLGEVLDKAGFSTDQKTFFIWEGVTYYITRIGVERTLQFVAEHSAPGSRIVFDYMLASVVEGRDYSPHGAKYTVFTIANMGEPYIYGIAPKNLELFVNAFGLDLLSNLGPSDLTRRYLVHSNGTVSGKIAAFLHIAHAQVSTTHQRRQLIHQASIRRSTDDPLKPIPMRPIKVPDDVKKLLTSCANIVKRKDFAALLELHSRRYMQSGLGRHDLMALLAGLYQNRPIHQFDFVLTHFERQGDNAKIDGYVQRKGFRTPLMINDIIKEGERWLWYGNQQR